MGADPFTGAMLGLSTLTGVGSAIGRMFSGGSSGEYFFQPSLPPMSAMLYPGNSQFLYDTLNLNLQSLDQQRFIELKQLEEMEKQINDTYTHDVNERLKQGLRDRAKVAVASAAANLSGNTANLLVADSDMQTDFDNTVLAVNRERSMQELKDVKVASTLNYWAQENKMFDEFFKASTQSYLGVFSDILSYDGGQVHQLSSGGGDGGVTNVLSSLSSLFNGLYNASSSLNKLDLGGDSGSSSSSGGYNSSTGSLTAPVSLTFKSSRTSNIAD